MMGHRGHLRRRVEGGHPPPARRALRRRRLGALPPGRGPLRVPQPGRAMPDKVAELVDLWWAEAEEYGVLPLDDRTIELFFTRYRDRSPHPTSRRYTYFPPCRRCRPRWPRHSAGGGGTWRPPSTGPRAPAASSTPRAPRTPGSASSSRTTGWSSTTTASGTTTWSSRTDRSRWAPRSSGSGSAAPGRAARPRWSSTAGPWAMAVPFVMTMISSVGPSVGYDHGSPVSERYAGPFPFEGRLERLDITWSGRPPATRAPAEADRRAAMSRQ